MQNVCQITFCQQTGKNKKHNQDALFNGETVFQFKLKTAEKRFENRPHFRIPMKYTYCFDHGVWQGAEKIYQQLK